MGLLERAARSDAPGDEVRRALVDAGQRLEALGAEPDPPVASTGAGAPPLAPTLRAELRRAARELAALAATETQSAPSATRFDSRPFLVLLERARAQLAGEIALGLTLPGQLQPV